MNLATQRLVLLGTVVLMVLFVLGNFFFNRVDPTSRYSLNTANQPTIGNLQAITEVVVFQDPKCASCRDYQNDVFPKIQEKYIETNKIRYTVIPVSFSEGSMPATEALLCSYYQTEGNLNSTLFFNFLNALYLQPYKDSAHSDSHTELLKIAKKANPSINPDKIRNCMERQVYYTRIMQNNAEASRVTNREDNMPAIFIDGVRTKNNDLDTVLKAIDQSVSP